MTVMVLNNREAKDKPKSCIHSAYSYGKRHLGLAYSVFVIHKIFRDVLPLFFSLMLVILLKLLRVNMDKSYWITAPNVHVLFR